MSNSIKEDNTGFTVSYNTYSFHYTSKCEQN